MKAKREPKPNPTKAKPQHDSCKQLNQQKTTQH